MIYETRARDMSDYHISGSSGGGGGDDCVDFWEGNRETPPAPVLVPITPVGTPIVFKAERFNGTSLSFNPNAFGGQLEFSETGTYRVSLTVSVSLTSPTETLEVFCLLQPGGAFPTPPNYISLRWYGHTTSTGTFTQSATRMLDVVSTPFNITPRIFYSDPNPPDNPPSYGACWFLVEKVCDEAKVKSVISYGGGT
jgi:hypothetical protein